MQQFRGRCIVSLVHGKFETFEADSRAFQREFLASFSGRKQLFISWSKHSTHTERGEFSHAHALLQRFQKWFVQSVIWSCKFTSEIMKRIWLNCARSDREMTRTFLRRVSMSFLARGDWKKPFPAPMSKITSLKAREILDSRGNPTVEVNCIESNSPSCYYAVDEVSVVLEVVRKFGRRVEASWSTICSFSSTVDELWLFARRFVAYRPAIYSFSPARRYAALRFVLHSSILYYSVNFRVLFAKIVHFLLAALGARWTSARSAACSAPLAPPVRPPASTRPSSSATGTRAGAPSSA